MNPSRGRSSRGEPNADRSGGSQDRLLRILEQVAADPRAWLDAEQVRERLAAEGVPVDGAASDGAVSDGAAADAVRDRDVRRVQSAARQILAMRALDAVPMPAWSDAPILPRIADAVLESEPNEAVSDALDELRRPLPASVLPPASDATVARELDALWEHLAATTEPSARTRHAMGPVEAPAALHDPVDFRVDPTPALARSLERLESEGPRRAPGWVWSRIRDDLQTHRRHTADFRRRRARSRLILAAATVVISAVLWTAIASFGLRGTPEEGRDFDIVVVPQSRPLDAGWSSFAALAEVRDGR